MQSNHKSIEHKLLGSLVKIQEALNLLGFDRELHDRAEDCKRLIETKQYNVAVMGEFKRGKSTLINALLREAVLPADATPTTATVNRITYGREKKAVIRFREGGEKEIGIGELVDYVTKITSDGEARAATVREAVVYCPSLFFKDHIDIIDTPGLNDDEKMTKITLDMLGGVDAVIVPIHAKIPFSESERKFVCQVIETGGIDNIVFVINFMDSLDDDDYVYETFLGNIKNRVRTEVLKDLEGRGRGGGVIAKAHKLLDDMSICGISARLALKSYAANDYQKVKESRFEEFYELLRQSVTSKQIDNAINKTIKNVRRIVSEFEHQNKKRLDYFDRKARAVPAVSEYADGAGKRLNGVFAECHEKTASLTAGLDGCEKRIKEIFIRELSAVREDTHAGIRAALEKARSDAERTVMAEKKQEINKGVYDIFMAAAEQLINYKRSALDGILVCLDISGGSGKLSAAGLSAYAGAVLQNIDFTWSVSPIPDIGDLANVNVIETVARAAAASVKNYKKELESAAAAIRKNWFGQFKEDAYLVRDTVTRTVETQDELDFQKKAYIHNYRKYCESSKAILSECESLLEE